MFVQALDLVQPESTEEWASGHGGRFSLTYEPEVPRESDLSGRDAGPHRCLPDLDLLLRDQHGRLSPREREVLLALSFGASNKEIAAALFLAEETVKSHLRSVFAKLGARNRAHAVRLGFEAGLL